MDLLIRRTPFHADQRTNTSEQDSHALITVQVAVHTHVSHTVTHVHVVSVRYTAQRTLEQVHVSVKAKERVFSRQVVCYARDDCRSVAHRVRAHHSVVCAVRWRVGGRISDCQVASTSGTSRRGQPSPME